MRGGPDLGLPFLREADHLGIAAALDVEDAALAPAVLVVADQRALGVGGERRLAGAGEAEEERHVVLVAPVVAAAVHGKDVLLGQQVVHHREDALLDLARVLRPADERHPAAEVEDDEGGRAGAVGGGIGGAARRVDDREAGLEGRERRRILLADEHVLREEAVPRVFGDHAHRQPVSGIRTRVALEDEDVLAGEVGRELVVETVDLDAFERAVDFAPPDVLLAARLLGEELVVRRPPGVAAGERHERAGGTQAPLAAGDGVLVQLRRREVPVHPPQVVEAVLLEAVAAGKGAVCFHGKSLAAIG